MKLYFRQNTYELVRYTLSLMSLIYYHHELLLIPVKMIARMVVSIKARMNLELFSYMQAFMKTADCKKKML